MIWNNSLWPPGGFVYTDSDGLVHSGNNVEDLARRITDYRARRGLPIGNPAAEVTEQLCRNFPSRCLKGEPPSEKTLKQSRANAVSTSVGVWLRETWANLSRRLIKWVPEETVKERVKICLACPQHDRIAGSCASCQESQNAVSFQLRAGRDRVSGVLNTCTHFKTDARVDVLIDQPTITNAPEGCWKRG